MEYALYLLFYTSLKIFVKLNSTTEKEIALEVIFFYKEHCDFQYF